MAFREDAVSYEHCDFGVPVRHPALGRGVLGIEVGPSSGTLDWKAFDGRLRKHRILREGLGFRGTSLIRNRPPPRTVTGSYAQAYGRVLGGGIFS